jgi:hypothetical protein
MVGKMKEIEVTFRNEATIGVQAQIYAGRTLISTCVARPGETGRLRAESAPYDIFFKNSTTGWEVARQLDSRAKTVTLRQQAGRFQMTGSEK